ncbi:MAG TPA: signal peptidase I [Candidatus Saccharimonadia bacterium]|nr:signal peptidase I [Candidatus Saccharimonadia bacterium]
MLKRVVTSLSIALLVIAGLVVLLFSWSGTGFKALSIPTGSMRPAITPGSLVLVHRVPASSLKVGDVITYINPQHVQQTVSHRVVKTYMINGKVPGFVTKGDANKSNDMAISSGSVIGKVIWHAPHLGSWLVWGKQPVGLLLMIYIPAMFMMAEEVKRMADYLKSLQPYRLPGFGPPELQSHSKKFVASVAGIVFVVLALFMWQQALALIQSNTVTLGPNNLSVAASTNQCPGKTNNHTTVNVNDNSHQTATSGSASSNGNTSPGTATSGSASNSNSTSTTITVTNGC